MKINLKLSILAGILSFAVALGIGHYANNISTNQLEKVAGESLVKLSNRIADILDREMLERYREIEFASSLPPLINKNSTKEEIRNFLEKIKDKNNHHKWIGFALPDGTVKAGTDGYLEGKNASARPWLPGGLKGPYIGDVHDALLLAKLMPNTNGEAIYFTDVAFPVKSKDNEILGVLCTHLMWQWTRDVIRTIQKDHSVDIYLLSKDGMILVGPEDTERKNIEDISNNVSTIFKKTETSYKLVNWSEEEKYLTAQTISKGFEEYKGFEWRVLVRQSESKAFIHAQNNSTHILIMSILAGFFGAIVGIVISNIITSPLKNLSQHINDLKDGKYLDLSVSTNDEIGILQKAILDLNDSLKSATKSKKMAEDKIQLALKVFDQSLEGILICDKNNTMTLVNKAFTDITGYTQEEIYGKNPSILSSGEQNQEFYKKMWESIQINGKWEGKLLNKKKDGSSYSENLRISTLKDKKGNIVNYYATFNSGFN